MAALALSGTPGTGKSTVARRLGAEVEVREVGDLARSRGAATLRRDGGWAVDLDRLALGLPRRSNAGPSLLYVGHLAHRLPVRDVILLRCHPLELVRRLRSRTPPAPHSALAANFVAEATDLVLFECLARRRRVWEIDSTGRSVDEVAALVRRRIRRRGAPRYGRVDWLSDPRVTAHLLRAPP